ncbi:MAG TPA: PrpF domain-containing protein [Flexivirga sp.]|uniref:PrpF domain-containing protein n=1 Tax=Flexivirga sp. TaxID=1962927 RepID=UPI002CBF87E9|nr:PrpF domain-containing protein [Flexivirga sp.]HWC21626.1 PrpF domain-containing protein [Flexivirga sp.]
MKLHGTLVRGGTSKCWIFDAAQIDGLGIDRDRALLIAFGAEDRRQLDGVGGATSTTSKAAIVGPSVRADCDVDYTFAQVGIGEPSVEWGSNCGNCATAVGLYAVQTGVVAAMDPVTTVRIHNTNTGTVAETVVATPGGAVPISGAARVPGVVQPGVPVDLTFVDPAGGSTGTLLPTGHPVDLLPSGSGAVRATLADAGAPSVLVAADDLGLIGTESPRVLGPEAERLVALRRAAALAMGLVDEHDPLPQAIPKVGIVGPPAAYRTTDGSAVDAADYDLSVRMLSMGGPHPAIGLTAAVAVLSAATVPATLPALFGRQLAGTGSLRIGTAAGVVVARIDRSDDSGPRRVTLSRAARCIATAELFLPGPQLTPVGSADHIHSA